MGKLGLWGVFCLMVSAGFFANALWIYAARRKLLGAVPATATVVDVKREGYGGNAVSLPVFQFTTPAGDLKETRSLMGTGLQRFTIGQRVPIRFDTADPQIAEVDTFAVLWGTALLRAGFGVLFAIMGAVGLLV